MAQSIAEVYLLAIRKSMVPVIGEAVPHPFDEQIELDTWSWTLEPAEADDQKKKDAAAAAAAKTANGKPKDDKQPPIDFKQFERDDKAIVEAIKKVQLENKRDQKDRDRAVLDQLGKSLDKRRKDLAADAGADADTGADDGDDRFTFKFGKNVDLATTQFLNSMKAGEVFPRMVMTITHRAKHAPLNLIITFKNVTLLSYTLTCQGEDTMSDVTEEWSARFEQIDYVYQNRPGIGGVPGLTQGTARIFKMNLKKLF